MDTDTRSFEIRIDVGNIEAILAIVSLLRHTQYPSYRLYLECDRSYLSEHHEYLRSRTVPPDGDSLLEYEDFDRTSLFIDELFIGLVIREPYGEFFICEADTEVSIQYLYRPSEFGLIELSRRLRLAR